MRAAPDPLGVFDLHIHSNRSDGRFDPVDVLERAAAGGLGTIALTEHDLVGSLDPGVHQVGSRRVHVISGAEVSGMHDGSEHHLLVYFPGEAPAGFRDFCAAQVARRVERYEQAVQRIGLPGIAPPSELARRGEMSLTRHHLARALIEVGHAKNLNDAFAKYASHGYVPRIEMPFTECIRIARSWGGTCSWAHPRIDALQKHLPVFVEAGLQGLEGLRPGLRRTDKNTVRKAAKRHGLYLSGGSDWHGWHDSNNLGLYRLTGHQVRGFLDALAA
ncbi:MAG: putative metal-dependent phosphoesterase TrpH [Kiritimatiellia bacterium]|jgi:predicted metal-dependent phosphoesterase TrpH